MVVKHINEYINDQLSDRISILQSALYQAEKIMITLEKENNRLKDVLNSLASENKENYDHDREIFNESVCSV